MTITKEELIENIEILADKCEELIKERDEARRKFCEMMSNNSRLEFTTPQWFAEEENWDCFKIEKAL